MFLVLTLGAGLPSAFAAPAPFDIDHYAETRVDWVPECSDSSCPIPESAKESSTEWPDESGSNQEGKLDELSGLSADCQVAPPVAVKEGGGVPRPDLRPGPRDPKPGPKKVDVLACSIEAECSPERYSWEPHSIQYCPWHSPLCGPPPPLHFTI